ncbi:MAG: DNA polymerase subunit beta [Parcubacteria group bacterium Gr01-1014_66]|nr:MAG: DNA polymerase subunit beta [Parcubacteria group bacterium Gr01-1014_66]
MERIVTEQKIREVTERIVAEFQPEKIILFGSYAWGEPGPDSDVDLLIVKKTDRSTREVAREIDGSIFPRPFPIDFIVYTRHELEEKINRDRNLFLEDIVRNGKVLYSQPQNEIQLTHKPAQLVLSKI